MAQTPTTYTVQDEDEGSYLCAKATYSIGGTQYSAEKISDYKVGRNLAELNANPTFGADTSVARMVYEGGSGMMVGDPVTATDVDSSSSHGDQLNYILVGGADVSQVRHRPEDRPDNHHCGKSGLRSDCGSGLI